MKIKEGMILSEIGDAYVAVPVGKSAEEFHGLVRLNESAAEIWKKIEAGMTTEEIVAELVKDYNNLDPADAKEAVNSVIVPLITAGLLEE